MDSKSRHQPETVEEDACKPSLTSKLTPYARHRACVQSMRKDLDNLDEEQEQTEQKAALTKKLSNSVKQLMTAQVTDENLVEQELAIAQLENARIKELETESNSWKAVAILRRTGKEEERRLSDAVLVSRQSQRTLKAKLGVYQTPPNGLQNRKALPKQHFETPQASQRLRPASWKRLGKLFKWAGPH